MKFISIKEEMPAQGAPVLLYNKEWIDDFHPEGVVMGSWSDPDEMGADIGFQAAFWNGCHDCYVDRENVKPTHWAPVPLGPDGITIWQGVLT